MPPRRINIYINTYLHLAGQDTGRTIPSRSDETVPVARDETSSTLLRSQV